VSRIFFVGGGEALCSSDTGEWVCQYITIGHIEYDDAPWLVEPDTVGNSSNRIDENGYGSDVGN